MSASANPSKYTVRVDTHVHFHSCFVEGDFLEAASMAGAEESLPGRVVLCLTESAGMDWFSVLRHRIGSDQHSGPAGWTVRDTHEVQSVVVEGPSGNSLVVVAGRQIVCAEGLEVLALGSVETLSDGLPMVDVMQQVSSRGALVVLPWGFGKWFRRRGEIVRNLIQDPPCDFFLGDNGGRLALWPEPKLLREFRKSGGVVLPGSDPFPFSWDMGRVGSFGIQLDGSVGLETPFADLKALLSAPQRRYGRLESLLPFVRNQVAIQLRRFLRSS